MKVTERDIAEFEAEGCEVRQQPDGHGKLVHVIYRDGQPGGCMEYLPEYQSVAARETRAATYEESRRRSAERQAERKAEREAGG